MRTRIGLYLLGVLLLLAALYGCTLVPTGPTLTVAVSPEKGHPPFTINVAAACSENDGTYYFRANGKAPIESASGSFQVVVDTWPYTATVAWVKDDRSIVKPISLSLVNKPPTAHDLWLDSPIFYLQKETIDLRYREAGCRNGNPLRYFGIEDPDYTAHGYSDKNDHFLYRVVVYDKKTGAQETVYDSGGHALPAGEYRSQPIFYWFPGWTKIMAPFPLAKPATVEPGDEPVSIKLIDVYVKEFGELYRWRYEATVHGGPCNS